VGSSLALRKRGPLSELGVPDFGEGVLPPSARWTPSLIRRASRDPRQDQRDQPAPQRAPIGTQFRLYFKLYILVMYKNHQERPAGRMGSTPVDSERTQMPQ
jgi:hypothetical protein